MPKREDEDRGLVLDRIGKRRIVNGRVVWEAPPNIDPALAELVRKSVAELNKKLKKGELRLNRKGEVVP